MKTEQLYQERLQRYVTAMHNGKPDRVPIRPFVAEFTAKYAGYTCQEVTHDYRQAFAAARKCAADFDWDAVVGNMVYVWTGLTQAVGLNYYAVPGIDVPADTGFQYLEPPSEKAYMRADEYDAFIADPTDFLISTWLPRVAADVAPIGSPVSRRSYYSFLKGGMALLSYFNAFGEQNARLRSESGTVSAISGMLKAPFDVLADKFRGYFGLVEDVLARPEKVRAACEALMPHLLHIARGGADPDKKVPVASWLHRGCVPFFSPAQFDQFFWPTYKPLVEELWAAVHQTLLYAEGKWDRHLDRFAELPEQSVIYHVDRGDIMAAHKAFGHKFCLSGGLPNTLLSVGTPADVREKCKWLIDNVAQDGGYIMDASAIVQNDARAENIRAMTEFTREYGVYSAGSAAVEPPAPRREQQTASIPVVEPRPGVCIPWEEKAAEIAAVAGDPQLVRSIWEEIDEQAYTYLWHLVLSF